MTDEYEDYKLPPDIFKRGLLAESLCEIICSAPAEAISPLVLQGPWGSGKTVHARRIQKCILNKYSKTHKCIYWDAANCDYAADPLPLFVSFLYHETDEKSQSELSHAGLSLCGVTALSISKELGNLYLKNKFGVDGKEFAKAVTQAQDASKKNLLRQFESFLQEAEQDKSRIQSASKIIDLARGEKELVIIIDELDRCRPDFALKTLEFIKFFFSQAKCKFILVMNNQSFVHSIHHLYGLPEKEANLYLNKYIKVHFQLPQVTDPSNLSRNCNYLYFLQLINVKDFTQSGPANSLIRHLTSSADIQLREIEKWVNSFNFLFSISKTQEAKDTNTYHPIILLFVSYLVSIAPSLLDKIKNNCIDPDSILKALGLNNDIYQGDYTLDFNNGFIRTLLIFYYSDSFASAAEACRKAGVRDRVIFDMQFCVGIFARWLNCATFLSPSI